MGKHIDADSGQVINPVRLVADESTPPKRFKNMGAETWAEVQSAVCENITGKFREAFETYMAGNRWLESKAAGDLIYLDGNAAAASYLVISKDPFTAGSESSIELEQSLHFTFPTEISFGLSLSQCTLGQEFSVEVIDAGPPLAEVQDIAIAAISQTSTTLTIDTELPHGLSVGKSIGIRGCASAPANYPALVVASVPSPKQITATAGPGGTIASQTIANPAGDKGFIFFRQRLGRARNGVSQIFENRTATNASLYVRSESGDALPSGAIVGNHSATIGSSAALQLVNAAYTYALGATTEYRLFLQSDRVQWADSAVDSTGQTSSRLVRTQVCPDPEETYKLRFRATNAKSLTVPIGQIISVSKTGSTAATIVFDRPHLLAVGDPIVAYGPRDQANFANLTAATAVSSVVNPTTITVVWGSAVTATTFGGYAAKVQGGNLMSSLGALAQVAQSAQLSTLADGTRQLVITGNANWSGALIGDGVNVVGARSAIDGASIAIDGAWKVANIATTFLTLVPLPGTVVPEDFGPMNCGGAIIKRTEMRLSFVRIFDFERLRIEALARPASDAAAAMPVVVQNTLSAVSTVTNGNVGFPGSVADVASAALTASATVAAVTPTYGCSYEVNIPVTAVSGAGATLDVSIEESDDSGTNWYNVYEFPRISAVGIYRSPKLALTGNRVRYVQTVGGTSPSFTRAINRNQCSDMVNPVRQLINRSIALATLNSATPSLNAQNCRNAQLVIKIGAATTPPQLQLEGSDDNGASWYPIGTPLAAVASSTAQTTVANVQCGLIRARVSTAGAAVTADHVLIKGF